MRLIAPDRRCDFAAARRTRRGAAAKLALGYAFLFPDAVDLPRAKELLAATGREVSRPAPLMLVYDSDDVDARAIAERVAVNLREAGIVVQISGQSSGSKNPAADMRLMRIRIAAPDPGIALAGILTALGEPPTSLETIDQEYPAERAPIDAFRVVPLVHVTENYGLSPQVRDWMPPRWGDWRARMFGFDQPPAAGEKSAMSFRSKLLAFSRLTIVAAVTRWSRDLRFLVYTRRAFEDFDRQRTEVLVAQFRREYAQRGEEIARRVQGIADAEATLRMAIDLNRPQADASQYYNDARGIAQTQQLDFLDIVADDGTLISSAEWPARFGYKNDWVGSQTDWNSQGAFLRRVDMPDSVDLGLLAVRTVRVGEKQFYLIGGERLDQNFLATLVLPENMRVLFYRNLEPDFYSRRAHRYSGPGGAGGSVRAPDYGSAANPPRAAKKNRLDDRTDGQLVQL